MDHLATVTTLIRPEAAEPSTASHALPDPDPSGGLSVPKAAKRKTLPRRLFSEGGLVFLISCASYIVAGILLDFHYLSFNGDAVSRMANGFYVLYSRDPHLAAIGFVWNPGTSIADLVPLLFYHLWTPLASHMFAGSLVSALAMAGTVYQVLRTLAEWGGPEDPKTNPRCHSRLEWHDRLLRRQRNERRPLPVYAGCVVPVLAQMDPAQ